MSAARRRCAPWPTNWRRCSLPACDPRRGKKSPRLARAEILFLGLAIKLFEPGHPGNFAANSRKEEETDAVYLRARRRRRNICAYRYAAHGAYLRGRASRMQSHVSLNRKKYEQFFGSCCHAGGQTRPRGHLEGGAGTGGAAQPRRSRLLALRAAQR